MTANTFFPSSTPAFASAQSSGLDDPRREIRIGGTIAALFLIGGIGWSAVARLDAAAVAPGVVKVSGERQVVQSLSGGIVTGLYVKEGDPVRAGQLLVAFATTELMAQERSLATRVIGLRAEIARLKAERIGSATIPTPREFETLSGIDREDAMRALAMEAAELHARRSADLAANDVLRQRIVQVGNQVSGFQQRQNSNERQRVINTDELTSLETLYRKGYTTKTRVLALRRQAASLDGDQGAQAAEIARLRSAAGETRMQILADRSQRAQQVAERQRAAEGELQAVLPQWEAALSQLARAQVRAPVAGTVYGLQVHTLGGVLAPGARILEVVPKNRALVIESQLATTDVGDVRVGQTAKVHLLGLKSANSPNVTGTLVRVSADSFTDEHSGRSYYTADVRIPAAELSRLRRDAGVVNALKPGAPVQVSVVVRARTALQYWLEPMTGWFAGAMHER
ncbi:MAG TPA: HlyD family type I secretion periplasmic adaptor subunit [Sphingomonas sp.]|jgi:HlyD family secretion protein|uniref:HlyD family type I secretion periplasmic adaptor subunit n=1 Tax=Sphingomonas sp. TaxID=28214 RepID=UPI002EDB86FD